MGFDRISTEIFQLYMKLKGTSPPLWRRLKIRGDSTLRELHWAIQCLMGWEEEHLHYFEIGRKEYGIKKYSPDFTDDKNIRLEKALRKITEFKYFYDFRTGWEMKITIEDILPPEELAQSTCTGGQRPGPGEEEIFWGDEVPVRKRRPSFDPEKANQCIKSWTPNRLMYM
jgi:hypothetical protein